jgi:hypothetical protein
MASHSSADAFHFAVRKGNVNGNALSNVQVQRQSVEK